MTNPNILTMNDEDFLREFDNLPGATPAAVVPDPVDPVDPTPVDPTPVDPTPADPVDPTPADPVVTDPATPGETEDPAAAAQPQGQGSEGEPAEAFDYKAAYESIVGQTYKYKGKEIVVKTAEEAKQLVQKGVGFHGRMAQMAGDMRLIETLRENGLLEESKINELIDISKKNPEAIRALVQSAGLEPHQLVPTGDAPAYTPGNHVLPEKQLAFRTSVDEVREQGGEQFLAHVAQDWDVASRAVIFEDPNALHLIYGHKQTGVYDKISEEVERRKVFDPNVARVPFIHAYLAVGNEMHSKGLLAPQPNSTTPDPVVTPAPAAVVPVPVAVKAAVASQPVIPNPAAAKAASVRSAPTPASTVPNYLTMPDEEFKKHHMTK